MIRIILLIGIFASALACQRNAPPPAPLAPTPSARQLAWHELEFYAFIHFNMNTFSNMEWGFGDENPKQFNPTELDCNQWVQVCKEAGMKGIILTAKHHDGFCLWPSAYTEHSVKNAPWKNGEGDVLKELSEACAANGLKFGVYLSPWDRNHPDYGKPAYITYFRNQLKELLTNYGDVFEVWFDGANGGTGYYGGANEERKVDKLTYYDWENTYKLIRELQPNAVIFSDAGPDIRWIGNEHGQAYPTTWSLLLRDSVYAGMIEYATQYAAGQSYGTHWVPAETNVSIRPGWYYHEYEDHKVKTMDQLVNIYYESIGRNSSFLLNFPVDKSGLIHPNDVKQLQLFSQTIKKDFSENLARGQFVTATIDRGTNFEAELVNDGDPNTYWATPDSVLQGTLTFSFDQTIRFNRLLLQEYIPLGQRIKGFTLEVFEGDHWQTIAKETTIGYKRILRFPTVETTSFRIRIEDSRACPTLSNIELYYADPLLVPPTIKRNQMGQVVLSLPENDPRVNIFYSTDGSVPDQTSKEYTKPFDVCTPTLIQAIAISQDLKSEIAKVQFDICAQNWLVKMDTLAFQAIDGDPATWWTAPAGQNSLTVDLGNLTNIAGFTYLPMQDRWISGVIEAYTFYSSSDGKHWNLISAGEIPNIFNNPTLRIIEFPPHTARFIRLVGKKTTDGSPPAIAELSLITN